ncbi:MAG TPA: hypothetical protein VFK06_06690 [Candidatus Angelobacter sp.]|nr:hypothetical protein [Candidatus Angelobacter sp.]
MPYPKEQTDELKGYCKKVSVLPEAGVEFLYLEELRLPVGCTPAVCDALLCPVAKDGYPSRLFFAAQVSSQFARNWNGTVRIGEKNWFAFSWKVDLVSPTLAQLLVAHLNGFAKEK